MCLPTPTGSLETMEKDSTMPYTEMNLMPFYT